MNDLAHEYISDELFPILKNRTLPKSRPEYSDYLSWLGLGEKEHDEFDELSRSGGLRATDEIELIPVPLRTEADLYEAFFFARGIRHLPPEAEGRVSRLKGGDKLFILKDIQNKQDGEALLLRTDDPISLVGYAPRYYSHDFNELVQKDLHKNVNISIEQVNAGAPAAYRLLCKITAPWPEFFEICTANSFKSLRGQISDLAV